MDDKERKDDIAYIISLLMVKLGIATNKGTVETPKRVAKMLCDELLCNVNRQFNPWDYTLFDAPNHNRVVVKNIKFTSLCEHHLLPFSGYADVEYIPDKHIIGLSKIPRIVKWFCKKPQVQERLTEEIGTNLVTVIHPKYLRVTLHDVHHSCVEIRGVEEECTTDTIYEYMGDE